MFKKSFVAVLSAMAISATGVAATASSAMSNDTDTMCEYSVAYASASNSFANFDYSESSINKVRKIPYRLACSWGGVAMTNTFEPIITNETDYRRYKSAMDRITGSHSDISYDDAKKKGFCFAQNDANADYATANRTAACATYALATAKSIYTGVKHTPKSIHPNGTGVVWTNHGALAITKGVTYCNNLTESEILLAIDAQLAMGRPAIIHIYKDANTQHWATVIGKDDSKSDIGEKYTIIDPWDGSKRILSDMTYYKSGTSINGYAILGDVS